MTGFVGIAYVAQTKMTLADPETIFIVFSQFLFHPFIAGFLLAAILAAIMSTISSQLLVTSSSLTEDFYKTFVKRDASQRELVLVGRISVLAVALVAIALAYDRDSSVLQLVSNAWAGFGAAFGPLIILSLYWPRMTFAGALSGIVIGAATVLIWIYAPITINGASLSSTVYEIIPGFVLSTLAIVIVSKFSKGPAPSVLAMFKKMQQQLKAQS
jgi:SSS family solute:Na+ symporter/sodium/proline symporter